MAQNIAQRLIKKAYRMGFSRAELSRQIGISYVGLWKIEKGYSADPRSSTVEALQKVTQEK